MQHTWPKAMMIVLTMGLLTPLLRGAEKSVFPEDAERKAAMSPEELAWEELLEQCLGKFYLPRYKEAKAKGHETAWDYVRDDPDLPRVLLIGDSISRGYTLPIRRALAGKVNVHRAPENCGNTLNGIRKLHLWLGDGNWDVIHFNFGIHDRKFDPLDYAARLEMIVDRLETTGATLVWATSTPIPADAEFYEHGTSLRSNRFAEPIMKRHGIAINDLYGLMLPQLETCQNRRDCHFNAEGYDILGGRVAEAILAALARRKNEGPPVSPERAVETETVIFEDSFDGEALGDCWHVARGTCTVRSGVLHVEGPAVATSRPGGRALPRNVRLEYDVVSDKPGDLSALLHVPRDGDYKGGYFFGMASQFNTCHKLLLFGDELVRTTDFLIEPGKTYHVIAEKRGDRIRLLVDGREVVSAEGCRPIRGGSIGLYVWNSGRIDNVKVTQIPGTE